MQSIFQSKKQDSFCRRQRMAHLQLGKASNQCHLAFLQSLCPRMNWQCLFFFCCVCYIVPSLFVRFCSPNYEILHRYAGVRELHIATAMKWASARRVIGHVFEPNRLIWPLESLRIQEPMGSMTQLEQCIAQCRKEVEAENSVVCTVCTCVQ